MNVIRSRSCCSPCRPPLANHQMKRKAEGDPEDEPQPLRPKLTTGDKPPPIRLQMLETLAGIRAFRNLKEEIFEEFNNFVQKFQEFGLDTPDTQKLNDYLAHCQSNPSNPCCSPWASQDYLLPVLCYLWFVENMDFTIPEWALKTPQCVYQPGPRDFDAAGTKLRLATLLLFVSLQEDPECPNFNPVIPVESLNNLAAPLWSSYSWFDIPHSLKVEIEEWLVELIEIQRPFLDLPRITTLIDFLHLAPRYLTKFAAGHLLSAVGTKLKPNSQLWNAKIWEENARYWWNSLGEVCELPHDVLVIIQQNFIFVGEDDNHVYFDKLWPCLIQDPEDLDPCNSVGRRILQTFFSACGGSCAKYAQQVLDYWFDWTGTTFQSTIPGQEPLSRVQDFSSAHPNEIFLCIGIIGSIFGALQESNLARTGPQHPLVLQYAYRTLELPDALDPRIGGQEFFTPFAPLIETLIQAKAFPKIFIEGTFDFIFGYFQTYDQKHSRFWNNPTHFQQLYGLAGKLLLCMVEPDVKIPKFLLDPQGKQMLVSTKPLDDAEDIWIGEPPHGLETVLVPCALEFLLPDPGSRHDTLAESDRKIVRDACWLFFDRMSVTFPCELNCAIEIEDVLKLMEPDHAPVVEYEGLFRYWIEDVFKSPPELVEAFQKRLESAKLA